MPKAPLADRIDQGRGLVPADLVLKGGRVFDLITGDLVETDVAICGDTIVGVFGSYQGKREIDVSGRVLVPGFIDTHLHVESSLVTPHEFDRCVTPRGVTTAICDPHEIANVCGIKGIRFILESAPQLVMDLRALDPYGDDRGAAFGCRPGAVHGPPEGDRAGGIHELPRRPDEGCRLSGKAHGLPGPPYRRSRALAAGE